MNNNNKYTFAQDSTRTEAQYHNNLNKGWLAENAIFKDIKAYFKQHPDRKGDIEFNSKDKDRVIQTNGNKISSAPDFKVRFAGKEVLVEYKCSDTLIDFLSPKKHCVEQAAEQGAVMLFKRTRHNDFVLIDPNNIEHLKNTVVKINSRVGNNYCRYFEKEQLKPLTFKTLEEVMLEIEKYVK